MSIKLCCCLCFSSCSESKLLQNGMGESNDVYEIAVKYFDPMLLVDETNENRVLCQDCWVHIKDFHDFQQTVLMTRSQLEYKDFKHLQALDVKQEEELQMRSTNNAPTGLDDREEESEHDFFIKDDMEDIDENMKADSLYLNEDEDDKPLLDLKRKINQPKSRKERKCKKSSEEQTTTEKLNDIDLKVKTSKKVKKTKSSKDPEKIARITYCLEKCKESDAFIATWRTQLECEICQETYSNFETLRNHFREKHKTKCYIKCCDRKFYHRYVLVEHIQKHINPDIHKCDICDKVFSSNYNLKLHKKIVHELTKKLECDICHKFFKQKVTLHRHLLTHSTGSKDFICSECGRGYVAELLLKLHIKHVHNVDRVCDQCGKTIHGFSAMKKHLMEHAGIERRKFPCDICGAQLKSHNNLKLHKEAYHNDGSTIYVCSICSKVAASENALISHKKNVHENERKYKCTYCDKAFKRSKVLSEHIATHTGQDLYQCPHCPQTFKVSANMHHHRKKIHPIEWEEGRKRLQVPKININQATNQIVI